MELKISNKNIDVHYSTSKLKHSLMYSLFASQTINKNIDAEIERIERDVHRLEGMLSTDISKIILLCQSSDNATNFHERILLKFNLTAIQAEYMIGLNIQELTGLNFALIKEKLEKSILHLRDLQRFETEKLDSLHID